MRIADRIGALERALKGPQPGDVPVFFIALDDSTDHGPTDKPMRVEHCGQAWQQEPGEDIDTFRARALKGALAMPRPPLNATPVAAMFLAACRVSAWKPGAEAAEPPISGGKACAGVGTISEDTRRAAPPTKKG